MNNSILNRTSNLDAGAVAFVPSSLTSTQSKKQGTSRTDRVQSWNSSIKTDQVTPNLSSRGRAKMKQSRSPKGSSGSAKNFSRHQKRDMMEDFFEEIDCFEAETLEAQEKDDLLEASQHSRSRKSKNKSEQANHLLNFQYEAVQSRSNPEPRRRRSSNLSKKGSKRWQDIPASAYFSKEQYLLASFRFMIYPEEDSKTLQEAFVNPNVLVDWDTVEQVVIFNDPFAGKEEPNSADTAEGVPNCPVCLDSPKIPKITRCGHIFCVVCILRHLEHESSKRCPMCQEQVSKEGLRAVTKWPKLHKICPGEWVDLPLLSRDRSSLSAGFAFDGAPVSSGTGVYYEGDSRARFSRTVIAHPQRVAERMKREELELVKLKEMCISCGETEFAPYFSEAIEMLAEKQNVWSTKKFHALISQIGPPIEEVIQFSSENDVARNLAEEIFEFEDLQIKGDLTPSDKLSRIGTVDGLESVESFNEDTCFTETLLPSSIIYFGDAWEDPDEKDLSYSTAQQPAKEIFEHPNIKGLQADSSTLPNDREQNYAAVDEEESFLKNQREDSILNENATFEESPCNNKKQLLNRGGSTPASTYYFYQCADGQWAFLHPLNMQCLLADANQDPTKLPVHLHAKVLEVESHKVTAEMRRRLAFLGHLPEHCLVHFLEVDLRAQLSEETLYKFSGEIRKRHQARKREERHKAKQRREEAKASAAHQALIRGQMTRVIDLHGPLPHEAAAALPSGSSYQDITQIEDKPPATETKAEVSNSPLVGSPGEGWSFSKVVAAGIAEQVNHFPTLGETASQVKNKSGPVNHPFQPTPAWGSGRAKNTEPSKGDVSAAEGVGTSEVAQCKVEVKSKGKKGKPQKVQLFSNSCARKYT